MTARRRTTPPDDTATGPPATAPRPDDRLPAPPPSPFRTPPVRILLVSGALLLLFWVVQLRVTLPDAVELARKLVSLTFLLSAVWVLALLAVRNRRRLLWRVRRRLLLSYLFLSVVPVVLVLVFALTGGVVLYDSLAAYLFHLGLDDVAEDVQTIGRNVAAEIGRAPAGAQAAIGTRFANWSAQFPEISLAIVPAGPAAGDRMLTAGPWRHANPPADVPSWVIDAGGFIGIATRGDGLEAAEAGDPGWVIRSAVPTADRRVVVVDLPFGPSVVDRVAERTGARIIGMGPLTAQAGNSRAFERTVTPVEVKAWRSGLSEQGAVSLDAPIVLLSQRVAAAQSAQLMNRGLMYLLILLAVLFAIIQGSALVMGGALARSITYAVHELFAGTERVRQGDFGHRIRVNSDDQLGDLADSFNRMSGSIEHLLHEQREKQRLEDELRIAREIQKSLLPPGPPDMPGLRIAGHCEPAREVGGDYYDFFELGPRTLGVLVADVSGKGTSAALYMAELKGLMLGISRTERSPRRLLKSVNRLLADHLDNRSFVTATYAVIDLDRLTLTCARAGHTPLMVVSSGKTELVMPDGMVLGLRLPGASERFDALLEEHTRPLAAGDLIVLYTDGVTEAMNPAGELFGDDALARVVASASALDPLAVRERIMRDVEAFVGDAKPHDDMTMVVIKVDRPDGTGDGPAPHVRRS